MQTYQIKNPINDDVTPAQDIEKIVAKGLNNFIFKTIVSDDEDNIYDTISYFWSDGKGGDCSLCSTQIICEDLDVSKER